MYVSDEYSELGQELKNGLVIDPPSFKKIPKLGAYARVNIKSRATLVNPTYKKI